METWVFDLDNTLYPKSCNLFAGVETLIRDFVAETLGLDPGQAFDLQKHYFREYGTTLRGLMTHHDVDPHAFLDHVHAIDLTPVLPDARLEAALARLSGRKIIFTNADTSHALRVLDRLGVGHHFDAVFDIVDGDFVPKPDPAIYAKLVARHRIDPGRTVMVEDIARNLAPAAALGMTTVWLRSDDPWGGGDADGGHVHVTIDDLTSWLEDVGGGAPG
jgi:putative hydrolase of the HAD superfamily